MAKIKAFRAIMPKDELADKVAALPYDVMNRDEARKINEANPYSFLHVDRADADLDESIGEHDDKVYEKALANYKKMLDENTLIKDDKDNLYIYQLTMNGRTQTGLVVLTSIFDYLDNKIKKHELTRREKEEDRVRHVSTLNAHTGPIFLSYKDDIYKNIPSIINNYIKDKKPKYEFTSDDGISHKVFKINDNDIIKKLIDDFNNVDSLYIADGHHRNASAVRVGLDRHVDGKELESDYYLSIIFPASDLLILAYNRLVKAPKLNKDFFMKELSKKFDISVSNNKYPKNPKDFCMYIDHQWYELKYKLQIPDDSILSLDVSILQNEVLEPLLDIKDPRTDDNISFVGGIRGADELEASVDSGKYTIAFSMYPTSMQELFRVADNEKIMPPKSTWFEPKLRSGLFIHEI